MPHIHDLIDFVVNVFIINKNKVLLVHHKKLDTWVPIGGHIELNEDPEEALLREVQEECGLKIRIISKKPKLKPADAKSLYPPVYLNIHKISDVHKHISFIYFAKSNSTKVKLAMDEHNHIKWFSKEDLNKNEFGLREDVKFYALKALENLGT